MSNNEINLTQSDALLIKKWKCKDGGTYRVIATRAAEAWPEAGLCSGNQLEGIELCKLAAKILGEDPWKAPWNYL